MIQVRKSIFETNSSSVHAICVCKHGPLVIPDEVIFHAGEYGWGFGYPDTKDYLFSAMLTCNRFDDIVHMAEILKKNGVKEILFDESEIAYYDDEKCKWIDEDSNLHDENYYKTHNEDHYWGLIDHSYDLNAIISELMADEDMLLRFLFANKSYVHTGNDNSDDCPSDGDKIKHEYNRATKEWEEIPNPNYAGDDFDYFEKGN